VRDYNYPHRVTVVRPASTTDAYGNATRDYAGGTRTEYVLANLQQRSRDEPAEEGRDAAIAGWWMATSFDLGRHDRVEWEGITFDVDGPPAPVYTPRGLHHREANLKVVDG
jgi:head-tail adaptor